MQLRLLLPNWVLKMSNIKPRCRFQLVTFSWNKIPPTASWHQARSDMCFLFPLLTPEFLSCFTARKQTVIQRHLRSPEPDHLTSVVFGLNRQVTGNVIPYLGWRRLPQQLAGRSAGATSDNPLPTAVPRQPACTRRGPPPSCEPRYLSVAFSRRNFNVQLLWASPSFAASRSPPLFDHRRSISAQRSAIYRWKKPVLRRTRQKYT